MSTTLRRCCVAAGGLVLATGTACLAIPAEAGPHRPAPVSGVTVTRFVLRDDGGHVAGRGATATLPGHPGLAPLPATASLVRIATVHRGAAVHVRHLGVAGPGRVTTASR